MKPADADLNAGRAQRPRDVHGAGKLVGLNPHQGDQALAAVGFYVANNALYPDPGVGFVLGHYPDIDMVAKHPAFGTLQRYAVQ